MGYKRRDSECYVWYVPASRLNEGVITMVLNENERWVFFYRLRLVTRPDGMTGQRFDLSRVLTALKARADAGAAVKVFDNDSKGIRIQDMQLDVPGRWAEFLFTYADKSIADPAFTNLETGEIRISPKLKGEGVSVSAHMVVHLDPTEDGWFPVALEGVPGVSRSRLDPFLGSEFKHVASRQVANQEGRIVQCWPVPEMQGLTSDTLKDAMDQGVLEGVELVCTKITSPDFDEPDLVTETRKSVVLKTKEPLAGEIATALLRRIHKKAREKGYDRMHVAFKRNSGKNQTTNIPTITSQDIAEWVLVHNEIVRDFEQPLKQACEQIRGDLTSRMRLALRPHLAHFCPSRAAQSPSSVDSTPGTAPAADAG